MFGKRVTLFELLGFKIQVDASWLILAALVTWSLAQGFFPLRSPGLDTATYWWMGVLGAAGLFLSLILHELSHSVMARGYGLPIRSITLFLFGGVAEMEGEPPSAKSEFIIAIAGPLASFALAAGFFLLASAGEGWLPLPAVTVLAYLAFVNGLLGAFNLIPAFPLDGGRVFRAILWHIKGDLRKATRISSHVGVAAGTIMIALGIFDLLTGNVIGGLWLFLIGLFLRDAANGAYAQLLTRDALAGEPVGRFMTADPVTAPPGISVAEFVEDYIYRYHHDLFPVTEGDTLLGYVGVREVKALPRAEWPLHTVATLMQACQPDNTVPPGMDAIAALALMQRTGNSRLMVAEGRRLRGILALKDLLDFLAVKLDLERES